MEKYKQYVSFLAKNNIDKLFINSDAEHALEVFVNLIQTSNNIIRIFAGCLCSELANKPEYIKSISDFVEKNGEVRILLNKFKEEDAQQSNLIKRLAYYKTLGKKVVVKRTDAKPHYANDSEKKEIHFTIGDEKAYRIETDIDKRTANCNFNNPSVAKPLSNFFDQIFNNSKSTELDLVKLFQL